MRDRLLRDRLILAGVATVVLTLLFSLLSLERGRLHDDRQSACARHLKAIGTALLQYSNEHRNRYPDSLTTLRRSQDLPTSFFVSPSDVAAKIPRDAASFDADDPAHCSYRYHTVTMMPLWSSPVGEEVFAFDRPSVHDGNGVHILFVGGHVEFFPFPGKPPAWWATFEASIARGDRPLLLPGAAWKVAPR